MAEKPAPLIRRPIPQLKSRNMKIGREGQLKRSWPVAPDEFFRIYRDEPLYLEVEFREKHPYPRVVLYTNLLCKEADEWSEIEFKQGHSGCFYIFVPPVRCGIFQFKIKHSPDNGKTWFWDRVPFTKVIVDTAYAKDIRMYTLIPSVSGTIRDWINALDHIANLGCNMVHLLPITTLDASESPYAAADLFGVDKSYLDPEDSRDGLNQFEDFVRAAKERGLRLCMDFVLNHIGITGNIAKLSPEWLTPDKNEQDGLMRAGCWHMNKWVKWGDLVKINYDHPEKPVKKALWAYMRQYAGFWAGYAAYTNGMIRFDNLHSSDSEFIEDLIRTLRRIYPDLVIQAEFFSDSNTLLKTTSKYELNLLLATPWEHPFAEDLRDYLKYLHSISDKLHFLNPLSTHDTGSPAQLYGAPEACVPRYFAVALMGTGQTGLVQGTEHGAPAKINFIGKSQRISFPTPNRFNEEFRKVNRLLAEHHLFHENDNLLFVDNNHGAVLAAIREEKKKHGEKFLLIANMDIKNSYHLQLDLPMLAQKHKSVVLHDVFIDIKEAMHGNFFTVNLEPSGIRAYRII